MLAKKEVCTGCGACAQICSKHSIVMKEDAEGFLYPSILEEKCIQCGMCEKVCPIIKRVNYNDVCLSAHVAYAIDEDVRLKSSSGGIFTLLAEQILSEGGVVFGAAFDAQNLVHHIGIEDTKQLELLRGSKYLQSRIGSAYCEAQNALKSGRKVLFTGTACQIAGLKKFLKREYDNLLTVDVLCHGVPSPKVWKQYMDYKKQQYNSEIQSVYFRHKNGGWKKFHLFMGFENQSVHNCSMQEDEFMQLFLKNICLRPSCYKCYFKKLERPSDITIGDAWGIHKYMPEMDDDKGTSVILIHTELGKTVLEKISDKMVCKEGEVDKLVSPLADSRKSVEMHVNRGKFFKKVSRNAKFEDIFQCLKYTYPDRIRNKLKKFVTKK